MGNFFARYLHIQLEILLLHGLSSRALLDDPVLLKRLEANAILHINSIAGTTGALLEGLGVAVATKLFVKEQLEAGTLVAREVIEPKLTRTLYLCRLRNRPMTYVMAADAGLDRRSGRAQGLGSDAFDLNAP